MSGWFHHPPRIPMAPLYPGLLDEERWWVRDADEELERLRGLANTEERRVAVEQMETERRAWMREQVEEAVERAERDYTWRTDLRWDGVGVRIPMQPGETVAEATERLGIPTPTQDAPRTFGSGIRAWEQTNRQTWTEQCAPIWYQDGLLSAYARSLTNEMPSGTSVSGGESGNENAGWMEQEAFRKLQESITHLTNRLFPGTTEEQKDGLYLLILQTVRALYAHWERSPCSHCSSGLSESASDLPLPGLSRTGEGESDEG